MASGGYLPDGKYEVKARYLLRPDEKANEVELLENVIVVFQKDKDTSKILKVISSESADSHEESPEREGGILRSFEADLITPPFFNAHTHNGMIYFRGVADDLPLMEWLDNYIWPIEKEFATLENVELSWLAAIIEMVKGGTLFFADMYYLGSEIFAGEVGRVLEKLRMKALVGNTITDFPNPDGEVASQIARLKEMLQALRKNQYLKPIVAPHAPYSASESLLKKCFEIAMNFGAPIMIHVAETRNEFESIYKNLGKTPVEYLSELGILNERTLAVHSVHLAEKDMAIYKDRDVTAVHCPESNLKLASGIAQIPKMLSMGINLALGTDGVASNNDLSMLGEMRTMALLHKGITLDPTVVSAHESLLISWGMKVGKSITERLFGREYSPLREGSEAYFLLWNMGKDAGSIDGVPSYEPASTLVYSLKESSLKHAFANGELVYSEDSSDLLHSLIDVQRVTGRLRELQKKVQKFLSVNIRGSG